METYIPERVDTGQNTTQFRNKTSPAPNETIRYILKLC